MHHTEGFTCTICVHSVLLQAAAKLREERRLKREAERLALEDLATHGLFPPMVPSSSWPLSTYDLIRHHPNCTPAGSVYPHAPQRLMPHHSLVRPLSLRSRQLRSLSRIASPQAQKLGLKLSLSPASVSYT